MIFILLFVGVGEEGKGVGEDRQGTRKIGLHQPRIGSGREE